MNALAALRSTARISTRIRSSVYLHYRSAFLTSKSSSLRLPCSPAFYLVASAPVCRATYHTSQSACSLFSNNSTRPTQTESPKSLSYGFNQNKVTVGCDLTDNATHLKFYIRAHEDIGRELLHGLHIPGLNFSDSSSTDARAVPSNDGSWFGSKGTLLNSATSVLSKVASSTATTAFPSLSNVTSVLGKATGAASSLLTSHLISKEKDKTSLSLPTPKGKVYLTHFHPEDGVQYTGTNVSSSPSNERLVEISYEALAASHQDTVDTLFKGNSPGNEKASAIVRIIADEVVAVPFAGKIAGAVSKHIFAMIPGMK